ncbi:MAG: FKBP-type peptidyl-prolyl cis-trans isomerase, partial [Candidatus Micrarchaeota archaeon]
VEYGDTVSVNYVLRVDGEVMDTNIESIAIAEGIYFGPGPKYSPLEFQVLLGEGLIDGFVNSVVGMKVADTKTFTIPPEDGYGLYDESLVFNVSRYYEMGMVEVVPLEYFEGLNITLENGTSFETDVGTVFIDSLNETHADLVYVFEVGDIFYYAGLPQMVVNRTNGTYTIMIDVLEGKSYTTLSPKTGQLAMVSVKALGDDTITFDENPFLSGKSLDYSVTLVSLAKPQGS